MTSTALLFNPLPTAPAASCACLPASLQATLTDWGYQLYLVMDRSGPFPLIFYIMYILLQCYFVVGGKESAGEGGRALLAMRCQPVGGGSKPAFAPHLSPGLPAHHPPASRSTCFWQC